jgi:hypothetical protein
MGYVLSRRFIELAKSLHSCFYENKDYIAQNLVSCDSLLCRELGRAEVSSQSSKHPTVRSVPNNAVTPSSTQPTACNLLPYQAQEKVPIVYTGLGPTSSNCVLLLT